MNQENGSLVKRVIECLNHGTSQLKKSTLNRLESIRAEAVSKHAVKAPAIRFAGTGHSDNHFGVNLDYRFWLPIGAFVFCLIALNYYQKNQQTTEIEEITELLTSDLPINAYLDQDFNSWLEEHSSSH